MSTTLSTRSIPVARPWVERAEEEAVAEILRSWWLSQGERVAEFERRFAEYVGAPQAVAVSSCTVALHLVLLACGIRTGDEILCPSFSFIATANAIRHAGGTPIFVDIDRRTFNLDPARLREAVSPRTRAILLVHQVGLPASLEKILALAREFGLLVIEDAACAVGSEYCGRRIGLPHSVAACFSFHPRKLLTTGEGGMISVADVDLAERLRRLRQHGMSISDLARHRASQPVFESYDEVGFNYLMTDLQAAIGLVQLDRLPEMLRRRRELAARYSELLSPSCRFEVPYAPPDCTHNFQSYVIRVRPDCPVRRDTLMRRLMECGVSTRRGVMAIHREVPYRSVLWNGCLRETESAADETLILPLFHQMREEQQDYIVDAIDDICSHR